MNESASPGDQPGELIALTGATGYVGGRLAPRLLDLGRRVRCIVREPKKLEDRPWRQSPGLTVARCDLSRVDELTEQLRGCVAAYYLVHSMVAAGAEYAAEDRRLAKNFADACALAGVQRIIYLGGLGDVSDSLSEHLRSRREVETILGSTGVPVTILRAAMIIGSGSASFEILQYLVNRLPIMITPRWVATENQPVAIRDVLHWLTRTLSTPETTGKVLELGGPDVLSYRDLMHVAAEELGLHRRRIVTVPLLTPRLSSAWISLVTPVPYKLARPLAAGLSNRVVVGENSVQNLMPHDALSVRQAIRKALVATAEGRVATRWSVAGVVPGDPDWAGGKVYSDKRSIDVAADPEDLFAAVCRVGGGHGWYAGDLLWKIRGWMDQLVGGPGLRRGRRHPEDVQYGEALDFWRVVGIEPRRSLSLRAEMILPGEAQLDFRIDPTDDQLTCRLTMDARFRPKGLVGIAYWHAVLPLHNLVFGGMLMGIRDTAEAMQRGKQTVGDLPTAPRKATAGYGRSRLYLGMTAVGTFVVLALLGLVSGLPDAIEDRFGASFRGSVFGLAAFVGGYALIHLPFDVFGGYVLPKRHGRRRPTPSAFALGLLRGVTVHSFLLFALAVLLTVTGRYGGLLGTVTAAAAAGAVLLRLRVWLASLTARIKLTPSDPDNARQQDALRVIIGESDDEGFTGGILGLARPTSHLLPLEWRRRLGTDGFALVLNRRSAAVSSGGWLRGRLVAGAFTLVGVTLSAIAVGDDALGSLKGTISLSLYFTLWSFLGLLVLPTLSRWGVAAIDQHVRQQNESTEAIEQTTRLLDSLQDNEPSRAALVETIFHPIPSVENRLRGPTTHGVLGAWDAARTAVFLSACGIGLLGRAVHCNCGRPALWVLLPTD